MIEIRLREKRLEQGLTLQELSEKSGVSYSYISQVERGNKQPTVRLLSKLSAALGLTLQDVMIDNHQSSDIYEAAQILSHLSAEDREPIMAMLRRYSELSTPGQD